MSDIQAAMQLSGDADDEGESTQTEALSPGIRAEYKRELSDGDITGNGGRGSAVDAYASFKYMSWFDDTAKKVVSQKVSEGARHYATKNNGSCPSLCLLSASDYALFSSEAPSPASGELVPPHIPGFEEMEVGIAQFVRPNYFYFALGLSSRN